MLDMATTVVPRGKIEVYDRLGKELPVGWAVDKYGLPARDAHSLLHDIGARVGGGILPLGGLGEEFSGYKGYGLAVMVDILCGVLCGAPFGRDVQDTGTSSARVSHFFGAVSIDRFRDPHEFRREMDNLLRGLRTSPPARGGRAHLLCRAEGVRAGGCLRADRRAAFAEDLRRSVRDRCGAGGGCTGPGRADCRPRSSGL